MPLQGTFDVLDFGEVLRLLAARELTGRLFVRHRSFAANLFLQSGTLIGADHSEHQPAAASGDVGGRIQEVCFEMLEAERGSFEFHPGRGGTLPVATRLRVEDVLARAQRRLDEWHELQEVIPSMELQPRLVLDLGGREVNLDRERWRLLTTIDGRRNLRLIGRALNLSDFDVCRLVRSLVADGIVELDGLAAPGPGSDEPVGSAEESGPGGGDERTPPEGVAVVTPIAAQVAPDGERSGPEPGGADADGKPGPASGPAEERPRPRLVRIRGRHAGPGDLT